jgi:uncharacterized membrane protein (Fun14 family)
MRSSFQIPLLLQVSKIIAFGVGGVFITLQALSYNGLININYEKVQKSVEVRFIKENDEEITETNTFYIIITPY